MTDSNLPTGRLRKFIPQPARYAELYGNFTITERDLHILKTVHRYRFVQARHIRALTPGSSQQITRRLQGLFHNGYLGRFLPPMRMRLDLEKGTPLIAYGLERAGANVLAADGRGPADLNGLGTRPSFWNKSHSRRTEWFLRHSLMVSTFRCVLELAVRDAHGSTLLTWEQGTMRQGTRRATPSGKQIVRVAPDAYFTLSAAGITRHCFLEADRSTEELDRLKRKYANYWWYLQSPEFLGEMDAKSAALVLFVTTGSRRLRNMMEALTTMKKPNRAKHAKKGMFWFCVDSDYTMDDPISLFTAIWRVTNTGDPRSLGVPLSNGSR